MSCTKVTYQRIFEKEVDFLDILNPYVQNRQFYLQSSAQEQRQYKWALLQKIVIVRKDFKLINEFAKALYDILLRSSNPVYSFRTSKEFAHWEACNFHGGCNDIYYTQHEFIFAEIFPNLQKQVAFGTGKGGYKKYRVKRYIADFVEPSSRTIIEIDGDNHAKPLQSLKDEIRELFFQQQGYTIVRFTNQEVLALGKLYCNVKALEIKGEILNEQRNRQCIY